MNQKRAPSEKADAVPSADPPADDDETPSPLPDDPARSPDVHGDPETPI
jgi:hypothetical protein